MQRVDGVLGALSNVPIRLRKIVKHSIQGLESLCENSKSKP